MSVSDFETGLSVKDYEERLPVQRRVKLPTKAEEAEDFGIQDDGGCPGGETCERITKALFQANSNSGGKRKTKKRRRKRRKKSRKKRKRKTRRKLRKRKKKTKRRRRH